MKFKKLFSLEKLEQNATIRYVALRMLGDFRSIYNSVFTLKEGTDIEGTIETIRNNVWLRGANLWILVCAAMLASLGLDINSVAVIIGAMLISPLMSPILGIGLSVGINDRNLLISSIANFTVAVVLSILASTFYFLVTPLGDPTTEIVARTSPTLLDVGVAIFGGVAGIVAGSRKEKTNAIPGVAIATALMPPLCTAGFGLATGRMEFFFGAFYLFFLNAVFISLSTYVVVRFLKFPSVTFVDPEAGKKVHRVVVGIALIAIIPSAYILFNVIQELREKNQIESFIAASLVTEDYEPINWELMEGDSTKYLKVYMVGKPIEKAKIDSIAAGLGKYGLECDLKVVQMNLPPEERKRLVDEAAYNVLNTMELSQQLQDTKQTIVDSLQGVLVAMRSDTLPIWQISNEVRGLFPELAGISYAPRLYSDTVRAVDTIPMFFIGYSESVSRWQRGQIQEKLGEFLRRRIKADTVRLVAVE